MNVPKSQSEQLFESVLSKIFESSKEYRTLAKEFLSKADALEAETLKLVVEMKRREDDALREALSSEKK